jgi:hypothetical protein
MKISHTLVVRHRLFHHQTTHKVSHTRSGNGGGKKIDSKLKKFADRFGAEGLAQGLTNHLGHFVAEALNRQLNQSPLPKFIQDELRTATMDQCAKSFSTNSVACQAECNLLVENYAALIEEPSISGEICETLADFVSSVNTHANTENSDQQISLSFLLNYLYEKLIFQAAQIAVQSDIDDESSNWLLALVGAFSNLQTEFLSAATKNLSTMEECSRFTVHNQATLDLMTEDDRNQYQFSYSQSRKRFVVAQSHFKANLHLFTTSTFMLTNAFNLFKTPCDWYS